MRMVFDSVPEEQRGALYRRFEETVAAPLEYGAAVLARGGARVVSGYVYLLDVKEDNNRLVFENARLRGRVRELESAEAENRRLRRLRRGRNQSRGELHVRRPLQSHDGHHPEGGPGFQGRGGLSEGKEIDTAPRSPAGGLHPAASLTSGWLREALPRHALPPTRGGYGKGRPSLGSGGPFLLRAAGFAGKEAPAPAGGPSRERREAGRLSGRPLPGAGFTVS